MLPIRYYINEYEMMEDFAGTIEDTRIQNQLQGRVVFRIFKDNCINFDIIDNWYKFRN